MTEQVHAGFHAHRHLGVVLLTGAIAWTAQFYAMLFISGEACMDGTDNWGLLSGVGVRTLLTLVSLTAFGAAAWGVWNAYKHWSALSGKRSGLIHAEASDREEFMAFCGLLVAGVFVVGILWTALPVFTQLCARAR